MSDLRPFHLAFPVHDLDATRDFWFGLLGCTQGRSASQWVDINLYGHQLTAHLVPRDDRPEHGNEVDTKRVPIPHFGVVLRIADWQDLADKLSAAGTDFIIAPYIRFKGKTGEQATMFFRDPSGNAIEMKAFADDARIFAPDKD